MASNEEESVWMHISDMMSVLMMIFLFVSISYMLSVTKEKDRIEKIASTYQSIQDNLYLDLEMEFKDDFSKWNAVLDKKEMTIRFQEPDVLFKVGQSDINEKFRIILKDFFPRYIKILSSDKYIGNIEEIRIEGHTSSEWSDNVYGDIAYLNNMELSQGRTREVLMYCLSVTNTNIREWTKSKLTANGLSSSKIIVSNGIEDKNKSRRVEFRVRTNAEKVITNILNHER